MVRKYIIRIFFLIMAFLFSVIIINIFINNTPLERGGGISLLIGIIFYLLFLFFVYKLSNKFYKKHRALVIISFIIFVIFQIVFAYFLAVNPSWDFGNVYNYVVDDINGGYNIFEVTYFYQFNLNIGIALLLKLYFLIFSFLGINNYLVLGIALNIIFIDIALLYLYKFIKLISPSKYTYLFLIVALTFTPFITYVPIFYSDTLSLPFGISSLYYLYKYFYIEDKKRSYLVISGLLLGIGVCLKFTLIIIYIALLIVYLLKEKGRGFIVHIKPILLVSVFIFIPIVVYNGMISLKLDEERSYKEQIPLTHNIMMGLRKNGGFSIEDSRYTVSFPNKDKKQKANIKVIKDRLSYYFNSNKLVDFYTNKLLYTWGDGTFFASEKLKRENIRDTVVDDYIYGSKKQYYFYLASVEWIIILIMLVAGIIYRKNLSSSQRDLQLFIYISLFGVMLFFLLWECRSRYLINFLPLILLGAYLDFIALSKTILVKLKKAI